jgi:hypothetical protein
MWAGAYLFGRSMQLGRAWYTMLAVAFCFAPGFMAHFQQQPRAVAHMGLPWLLWSIERLATGAHACARALSRKALPIALSRRRRGSQAIRPPSSTSSSRQGSIWDFGCPGCLLWKRC